MTHIYPSICLHLSLINLFIIPFDHHSFNCDVVCPKRVAVCDVLGSRWPDTFRRGTNSVLLATHNGTETFSLLAAKTHAQTAHSHMESRGEESSASRLP